MENLLGYDHETVFFIYCEKLVFKKYKSYVQTADEFCELSA